MSVPGCRTAPAELGEDEKSTTITSAEPGPTSGLVKMTEGIIIILENTLKSRWEETAGVGQPLV